MYISCQYMPEIDVTQIMCVGLPMIWDTDLLLIQDV